jgi:hypothetical protein
MREGLSEYYFFNMGTETILDIATPGEKLYGYVISPNKKFMLADACNDDTCYYILRSTDRVINTIPSHNDWVLGRWLDNERVVFLTLSEPNDVVILNPFRGSETKIHLEVPNPYINKRTETESLIPTSLDLSTKRVLFYEQENGDRLVLWDLDAYKKLTSLPVDFPDIYQLMVG